MAGRDSVPPQMNRPSAQAWAVQRPKTSLSTTPQKQTTSRLGLDETVDTPEGAGSAAGRGSVRAMAARFKGQDPQETAPVKSEVKTRQSLASLELDRSHGAKLVSKTPRKSTQQDISKTEQVSTPKSAGLDRMKTITKLGQQTPKASSGHDQKQDTPVGKLRGSISNSVALRAAALMDTSGMSQQDKKTEGPKPGKTSLSTISGHEVRSPSSLGTMVAHREQPPVAQHISPARPPSTQSAVTSLKDSDSAIVDLRPNQRSSSASLLHSQVRHLQRQLAAKMEETAQLRRQLEAQENADVGTLSEQLREARRDTQMWRERAEAAERRVKVFEKFTARLRGIREAAMAADTQSRIQTPPRRRKAGSSRETSICDDVVSPNQHGPGTRQCTVTGSAEGEMSDCSGATEDAGTVTARIRKCLHGSSGRTDGAGDEMLGGTSEGVPGEDEFSRLEDELCALSV